MTAETTTAPLEDALTRLGYTQAADGTFVHLPGTGPSTPVDEEYLRETIEHLDETLANLTASGQSDRVTEDIRTYRDSYVLVLDAMLALPGYVSIADRSEPTWKTELRNAHITDLESALTRLDFHIDEENGILYTPSSAASDEEFFLERIEVLSRYLEVYGKPSGSGFENYHSFRLALEAYEFLLNDFRTKAALKK